MNLCFLTDEQKKLIAGKPHTYTKQDVNDLSLLSSSIGSLVNIMSALLLDSGETDQGREVDVFNVLALLIKPIDDFFNEGAPLREKSA